MMNVAVTINRNLYAILLIAIFVSSQFIVLALPGSKSSVSISSPKAPRPTELQILSAIGASDRFIDSLYKDRYPTEVGSPNQAVVAEYPSIPLSIITEDGTVIHAGEDLRLNFVIPSTEIENVVSNQTYIEYDITFRKQSLLILFIEALKLHVEADYDYKVGSQGQVQYGTKITIKLISFGAGQHADIYLGSEKIGTASSSSKSGQTIGTYMSTEKYPAELRSFRYTERHGTQLAYEWYLARNDVERTTKLLNELRDHGYIPHKDLYAPLFGMGKEFSDNYQYEKGSDGVYRDCYIKPVTRLSSYQYTSKICTLGVEAYILASHKNDWLVPTLWAVHMLNKYAQPDSRHYDGDKYWSPREVARFVETKIINGTGIASPFDPSIASSVRTAAFLVLETLLGYDYGDSMSKQFADDAANILLFTQIGDDGIFESTANSGQANAISEQHMRRNLAGSYFTAWDANFHYISVSTVQKKFLDFFFNQPDESPDVKPSNIETTVVVSQSLRAYGCHLYPITFCTNIP